MKRTVHGLMDSTDFLKYVEGEYEKDCPRINGFTGFFFKVCKMGAEKALSGQRIFLSM